MKESISHKSIWETIWGLSTRFRGVSVRHLVTKTRYVCAIIPVTPNPIYVLTCLAALGVLSYIGSGDHALSQVVTGCTPTSGLLAAVICMIENLVKMWLGLDLNPCAQEKDPVRKWWTVMQHWSPASYQLSHGEQLFAVVVLVVCICTFWVVYTSDSEKLYLPVCQKHWRYAYIKLIHTPPLVVTQRY